MPMLNGNQHVSRLIATITSYIRLRVNEAIRRDPTGVRGAIVMSATTEAVKHFDSLGMQHVHQITFEKEGTKVDMVLCFDDHAPVAVTITFISP